jgi:hypothetical protein
MLFILAVSGTKSLVYFGAGGDQAAVAVLACFGPKIKRLNKSNVLVCVP